MYFSSSNIFAYFCRSSKQMTQIFDMFEAHSVRIELRIASLWLVAISGGSAFSPCVICLVANHKASCRNVLSATNHNAYCIAFGSLLSSGYVGAIFSASKQTCRDGESAKIRTKFNCISHDCKMFMLYYNSIEQFCQMQRIEGLSFRVTEAKLNHWCPRGLNIKQGKANICDSRNLCKSWNIRDLNI